MKKKVFSIILALVVLTGVTYGVQRYQNIGVYYGVVNKIFVKSVDKTTEFKEPFIHDGTTYVSLRDVSQALGEEVFWDAKSQSIYIGGKPKTFSTEEAYLTDIPFDSFFNIYLYRIDNQVDFNSNLDQDAMFDYEDSFEMRIMKDPLGIQTTSYETGISLKAYDDYSAMYYDLNGKYDVLTGTIGFDYALNNGNYVDYIVNLVIDDTIYEYKLSKEVPYIDYSIPVTGGKTLKIEFIRPDDSEIEPFINIGNPILESHIYK